MLFKTFQLFSSYSNTRNKTINAQLNIYGRKIKLNEEEEITRTRE